MAANVDLITAQQPLINQLHDANLALSESIPSIQAQYNLIIEQMSRQGTAGSQIAIAKNQVFFSWAYFKRDEQFNERLWKFECLGWKLKQWCT